MKKITAELLQDMKPGTELVRMRRDNFSIVTYTYLGTLEADPPGYFYLVNMVGAPERYYLPSILGSRDVWALYDKNEFKEYQNVIISFHEDAINMLKSI